MKMDTPLHAEHQLDQLSGQFAHWRQHRLQSHERIPDPLWDQAVALTATLPISRVAKQLRLGGSDLKKHIANRQGQTAAPRPTVPGFVEVPGRPTQPAGVGSLEVELQRPDGARLRMHSHDASLPLAVIVRSFLEV